MCCFLESNGVKLLHWSSALKIKTLKIGRIGDLFMQCRWAQHKEHFGSHFWRRTHIYPVSVFPRNWDVYMVLNHTDVGVIENKAARLLCRGT